MTLIYHAYMVKQGSRPWFIFILVQILNNRGNYCLHRHKNNILDISCKIKATQVQDYKEKCKKC